MPSTACGGDLTRRPLAAPSMSPLCGNSVDVSKQACVFSQMLRRFLLPGCYFQH